MSFTGLLKKRCSWSRRFKTGLDEYRQPIYTDLIKGSNVICAFQKESGFNLYEGNDGGDFSRVVGMLYLNSNNDIEPNDYVTIDGSENYKVIDKDNFGLMNHHIECRVEKTKDI